jgi:hypothetical protein
MKKILLSAIFSLILFLHCTKNTLEPQLSPDIINQPDQFEFKVIDIRSVTQELQYQWQNNGINATIYNGSVITEGEANFNLLDEAGDKVFALNLKQTGDFFSSAGAIGNWTIRLNLNDVRGTIHFRVSRRP